MKYLLILFWIGSTAFAQQPVIKTQFNGYPYTCTIDGGSAAVECAAVAYKGPFTQAQSFALCAGAQNTAPADCAILAVHGLFSISQAIQLCTGVYTVGPANCGIAATKGPFSIAQSLQLCSSKNSNIDTANCAIRACQGPYTSDQAVQLCRGSTAHSGLNFGIERMSPDMKAVLEDAYKK